MHDVDGNEYTELPLVGTTLYVGAGKNKDDSDLPSEPDTPSNPDAPSEPDTPTKPNNPSEKKDTQSSNNRIVRDVISTNGVTIIYEINETPAYTGKKLRPTDFISYFSIDGKTISSNDIKIKTLGGKTAGSMVEVFIKKAKGQDKETSKIIKGLKLATVTIRPIEVSEIVGSSSNYIKEGQILVNTKDNGDISNVKVITSKKGIYSGDKKAKKIKVKKNLYTYDKSTRKLIFDGTVLTGEVILP